MPSTTKLKPPRLRYLGKVSGLSVYLVSGVSVRNTIDIDFTCGGNEAVYPSYVPPDEIWLDDAAGPLDRTATCLHEIVERDQMIRFGKNYEDAHEVASATERPFRRELSSSPPRAFDVRRCAAAYRKYLRDPGREPVIDRPNDPPRGRRQLDREIDEALEKKKTRPGPRGASHATTRVSTQLDGAALAKALPAYKGWTPAWEYPGFLAFHRGGLSVFCTPDYHRPGTIAVDVQRSDGTSIGRGRDLAWPMAKRTPASFMKLMRPVLETAAAR